MTPIFEDGRRYRFVKLVRDDVQKFIPEDGNHYCYETFVREGMPKELGIAELRKKLIEEALEYAFDPSEHELADVIETCRALAKHDLHRDYSAIEHIRELKKMERGGFDNLIGMFVETTGGERSPFG